MRRSTSGFPSLPRVASLGTGMCGEETQKHAPPLYSSILQRSPTSTSGNCGDTTCDSHPYPSSHSQYQSMKSKIKTSPVSIPSLLSSPSSSLGTYDCGFCRTNLEPESVYRSHPLRVNDIVVCPSLRKYVCCFCGATGDKAHTIKYCPKNPIGFFAKKARNSPVAPTVVESKICGTKHQLSSGEQVAAQHQPILSPAKSGRESRNAHSAREPLIHIAQDQESAKSDTECATATEDTFEPVKRVSSNWIEAKTKGRKKKGGK